MERKEEVVEAEQSLLFSLVDREDILEKKVKIYSRLLTDPALAKMMEGLGLRHEKRKEEVLALALGKDPEKKNGQGRVEMNKGKEEE